MPIGKVNSRSEGSFDNKLYVGGGTFKIVAINPTKAEKEKLYPNRQFDTEPVYTGERDGVKTVRIEFTLQSMDVENLLIPVSFFMRNEKSFGSKSGKTEVIDNYGRTAWLTDDELSRHFVPVFNEGTPRIDSNYHVALVGESQIVRWMKNVLGICDVTNFNSGKYIDNPADAEIYFTTINDWFNGNIKELVAAWQMSPDSEFTAAVGVRTTEKGSFHNIYPGNIVKAGNAFGKYTDNKMNRIFSAITDDKNGGRIQDTEYANSFIHEFKIDATELVKQVFSVPEAEDDGLPF